MRELSIDDEKRLESVKWLQGARLRGVQFDFAKRDVAIYALTGEVLVEVLCEDVGYATVPDLFASGEPLRVIGLVAQPLEDRFVVRIEFSDHPAQVHLQCQRVTVRKEAAL